MVAIFAPSHVGFAQQPTLHIPFPADSVRGVASSFTFKVIASVPIDTNSVWRKVNPSLPDSIEDNWRPNVYLITHAVRTSVARPNWHNHAIPVRLEAIDSNVAAFSTPLIMENKSYHIVVDSLRTASSLEHANGQLLPSAQIKFSTTLDVPSVTDVNLYNRAVVRCDDTLKVRFSHPLKGHAFGLSDLVTLRQIMATDTSDEYQYDTLQTVRWISQDSTTIFAKPVANFQPDGFYSFVVDGAFLSGDIIADRIGKTFTVNKSFSIQTKVAYEQDTMLTDTVLSTGFGSIPAVGLSHYSVAQTDTIRVLFPPLMGRLAFKRLESNIPALDNSTSPSHKVYVDCRTAKDARITAIYELLEPVQVVLKAAPGTKLVFNSSLSDELIEVTDSLTVDLIPHEAVEYRANTVVLSDTLLPAGFWTTIPGFFNVPNAWMVMTGNRLLPRPLVPHRVELAPPQSRPASAEFWLSGTVRPVMGGSATEFDWIEGPESERTTSATVQTLRARLRSHCHRWVPTSDQSLEDNGRTIVFTGLNAQRGRRVSFEYEIVPVWFKLEQRTFSELEEGGRGPEVDASEIPFGGVERVWVSSGRNIRADVTEYDDPQPPAPFRRRPFRVFGPCYCNETITFMVGDKNFNLMESGDAFERWNAPTPNDPPPIDGDPRQLWWTPLDQTDRVFGREITSLDLERTQHTYQLSPTLVEKAIHLRMEFTVGLRLTQVNLDVFRAPANFDRDRMPTMLPSSTVNQWFTLEQVGSEFHHDELDDPIFSESSSMMIQYRSPGNMRVRLAFNKPLDLNSINGSDRAIRLHSSGGIGTSIDPTGLAEENDFRNSSPVQARPGALPLIGVNFTYIGFTPGTGHVYEFQGRGQTWRRGTWPNHIPRLVATNIDRWADVSLELGRIRSTDGRFLRPIPALHLGYLESPSFSVTLDRIDNAYDHDQRLSDSEFFVNYFGGIANQQTVVAGLNVMPVGAVRYPASLGPDDEALFTIPGCLAPRGNPLCTLDNPGHGFHRPSSMLFSGARMTKEAAPFVWARLTEQDCDRNVGCLNRIVQNVLNRMGQAVVDIGDNLKDKTGVSDAVGRALQAMGDIFFQILDNDDDFAGQAQLIPDRRNRLFLLNPLRTSVRSVTTDGGSPNSTFNFRVSR